MSCGFQGYDFGADYPDSICIDGMLWDDDSGYITPEGWAYTSWQRERDQIFEKELAERLQQRKSAYGADECAKAADPLYDIAKGRF